MIDVGPDHLELIKKILKTRVENHSVWAFGSRITGKSKPYSDLDLVVLGKESLSMVVLSSLKEDFAQSNLPFQVDVVDWNRLSPSFQNLIKQNYVELA